MERDIETRCIHLDEADNRFENYGAISFPIYQTATYAHMGVGNGTGYDYSRLQNPTREHLEKIMASLEHGYDALAYSSGMAAISALMELFKPGDHIIADADLYGGSIRLFQLRTESVLPESTAVRMISHNTYRKTLRQFISKHRPIL